MLAPLLLLLLFGTLGYLWWQRRTTTLTRFCRWRQDRAQGDWACVYCKARIRSDGPPKDCMRG